MRRLLSWAFALSLFGCTPVPPIDRTPADLPLTVAVTQIQPSLPPDPSMPLEVVGGAPVSAASYVPGELIVGLSEGADARAIAETLGAEVAAEVKLTGRYARIVLPAGVRMGTAARSLEQVSGVRSVGVNWVTTPNYLASGATPNDPRFSEQWAHRPTRMLEAWRALGVQFSAANTAIAVLDSGCDVGHPEYADRVLDGVNLTTEHPNPAFPLEKDLTDLLGHGTHVAGIALGSGNDGQGISGVAWDAKLLPVKVLRSTGGTVFDAIRGVRYAADFASSSGVAVRVINMSLGVDGNFTTDAAFEDAMAYAWRKGIVVVVAVGNSSGEVSHPAMNPHGIAISSTSRYQVGSYFTELFSGFSNRGDRVDLAAPGGEILSTLPRNANQISSLLGLKTRPVGDEASAIDPPYGVISGTSMAAPYVSGLAALIAARYDPFNLNLTSSFSDRVANRLKSSADDLGPPGKDPYFGFGRVNAQRALGTGPL